ncbi:MAG TPA: hypothetical protein VGN12_30380 [Pirellulales bacterium]
MEATVGNSEPGDARPSRRAVVIGLLVLFVAAAVAINVYTFTSQTAGDRDPFIYAQVGKDVLAGKRLYSETWIDKPPLGLLMYAVPQLFVPRSYKAIVVFGAVILVAQGVLFACAFRRSLAAAAAAALFVMFYPLELGTFTWPSTEHFANLFVTGNLVIALAITRARTFSTMQCLAAGALAIAAFHVRQNTVLCGLLPVLAVCLSDRSWRERWRAGCLMIAGGLIVWAMIVVAMAIVGDLPGYWWIMFVHPRIFASLGSAAELLDLARYFAGTSLALFWVIFALLAAERRYLPLVAGSAFIGPVGCLLTFHDHPHYLVNALPYVALLIGLGTQRLAKLGPGFPWFSVAAIGISLLPSVSGRLRIVAAEPTYLPFVQIAAEVDRVAPENGTLWVCGPQPSEAIQFISRLPSANVFCWIFQMRAPWKELLPKPWDEIAKEYSQHPPDVIVVHHGIEQQAHTAAGPVKEDEYLQLLRALLVEQHYTRAAESEGYSILLRTN